MIHNIIGLWFVISIMVLAVRIWVVNLIVLRMDLIEVNVILTIIGHFLILLSLVIIVKMVGITIMRIYIWIKLIILLISPWVTLVRICVVWVIFSNGRRVRHVDIALLFDIWVICLILRDIIVVLYLRVVALILGYSACKFMFIDRLILYLFLDFFSIDLEHTIQSILLDVTANIGLDVK